MSHYLGRHELRRCSACQSIFPVQEGGLITHHCDQTLSVCKECGVKHDNYSSMTTGLSPCLSALRFEINETLKRVRLLETINYTLHHGALHMENHG